MSDISREHEKNNSDARKLLLKRDTQPESLPAEEDAQKIKRKIISEDKKILKKVMKKNKSKG